MKKLLLGLLLLTLVNFGEAQNQISIGSANSNELFTDSKFDPADGGTIYVGNITTNGDADCYIVKVNASGNIVWQQRFVNPNTVSPSGNQEAFYKIERCVNGDVVAVGAITVQGNGGNLLRGLVCRFSNTGQLLWQSASTQYAGTGSSGANPVGQIFSNLVVSTTGNIAVIGSTDVTGANNNGTHRGIVTLLNANGVQQWVREYNFTTNTGFYAINQLQNGNLIVAGSRYVQPSYRTMILEIGEIQGNIINRNVYTIATSIQGINSNINTMVPTKIFVQGNNVTIGAYGSTNSGGANIRPIQGIFNYNPATFALTGNLYYSTINNTTTTNNFANFSCIPIANDDYIIGETVNGPQNVFARVTNGQIVYTRVMGAAQGGNPLGSIGNMELLGNNNFRMAGSILNGTDRNGYSLIAPITLPIANPNLCNVQDVALINVVNAGTITRVVDAVNLTIQTGMNTIPINLQNTNSTVANICGTAPTCPSNSATTVSKCVNQSIILPSRAGSSYTWSPATGLSSTTIQNPVCAINTNTTYFVTVFNAATNCTNVDTVYVIVNPSPTSNLRDTTICKGDTLQLNATGGTTYSWTPNYNINNTTIANPKVWPLITTRYFVTITNADGCSIADSILVTVNECGCEDSCNWSLTGNSNIKTNNFIGSINAADFKIRTNNTQRMVVAANGNVGINSNTPTKLLDVNGEVRVANLPPATINNNVVFANSNGDLKSLAATGNTNQYLSGNGTWQNIPSGGAVNAAQGLTITKDNTVVLGDECGKNGGLFNTSREVNMNNLNLYFNTSNLGKVSIGSNIFGEKGCQDLFTRLELDTKGLKDAANDYSSPSPSLSGLRFADLTANTPTIDNKTNGVLSLDEDGDVIWVNACCGLNQGAELKNILDRLSKLETELGNTKKRMAQMDVILEKNNIIVLDQNVPNPFSDKTVISYNIPNSFTKAQLIFATSGGAVVKIADIKTVGKGLINVYANNLSSGLYTYTLIIDGKVIESKKMVVN